jgi:hypothetical protein
MGGGVYSSESQAVFFWDATDKIDRFEYDDKNQKAEIDFKTINAPDSGVVLNYSRWSQEKGQSSGTGQATLEQRHRKPGHVEKCPNGVTADFKENIVTVTLSDPESAKNAKLIYEKNAKMLFTFVKHTIDYDPGYRKKPYINDYLPRTALKIEPLPPTPWQRAKSFIKALIP